MALKFNCNHCDTEIILKFLKVGEEAKCKSCGKVSTIPEDDEGVAESQLKEDHTISNAFNGNDKKTTPSKSSIETPINCQDCGKEMSQNHKYCPYCGCQPKSHYILHQLKIKNKIPVKIMRCISCKKEFDKPFSHCPDCGELLGERTRYIKPSKVDRDDSEKSDSESSSVSGTSDGETSDSKGGNNIKNNEFSFGWGNFWIFMGFLQGGIAFVFSVIMGIQTEYLPNRGIGLLISILGIGSAYGLINRKLFGLYWIYLNLIGMVVVGFIGLVSGEEIFTIQGAIVIVASILWFIYFNKRKEMFN
jgi:DNA-directed RNA polymerase subunit M/transcription elongation factor TFIIS